MDSVKPLRLVICGIPNVGKSTLINTLVGRRMAKASDEAGITKLEQRITLADDFYLWDTPGMLWPRIIVPESAQDPTACLGLDPQAMVEALPVRNSAVLFHVQKLPDGRWFAIDWTFSHKDWRGRYRIDNDGEPPRCRADSQRIVLK